MLEKEGNKYTTEEYKGGCLLFLLIIFLVLGLMVSKWFYLLAGLFFVVLIKAISKTLKKNTEEINNFLKDNSEQVHDFNGLQVIKQSEGESNVCNNVVLQDCDKFFYKDFDCENKKYFIIYEDANGDDTEREIIVDSFAWLKEYEFNYTWNFYLRGFCSLRQEKRTFRLDRIEKCFIDGVELYNFSEYFYSIYENTFKWKAIKLISENLNELMLLVFMSRVSNGSMRVNQRNVIVKYLKSVSEAVDDDVLLELDSCIKDIKCDLKEFNKIIKNKDIREEKFPFLLEAAAELRTLKKQEDPMEVGVFNKIKNIF